MLIILIAILFLVAGALLFRVRKYDLEVPAIICSAVGVFAVAILAIFLIATHTSAPGARISVEKTYESIVYQIDNKFYSNDNEVGKFNLINQIREFNVDRAENKYFHNSPWTNWIIPDVYGDLPEIAAPEYLIPSK